MFQIAISDHKFCKGLLHSFQTNHLQANATTADYYANIPPEIWRLQLDYHLALSRAVEESREEIDDENKHGAYTALAINVVSDHLDQNRIDLFINMAAVKLARAYNDALYGQIPGSSNNVDDPAPETQPIQLFYIHFNFIKMCQSEFTTIRASVKAYDNYLKRIKETFAVEPAVSSNTPKNFGPYNLPYLFEGFVVEDWNADNETEVADFIGDLKEQAQDSLNKLKDVVILEIEGASDAVERGLNATSRLTYDFKQQLISDLHGALEKTEARIDKVVDDAEAKLEASLRKYFAGNETESKTSFLSTYQGGCDNIARQLNNIGKQVVDDFITIFQLVFGI